MNTPTTNVRAVIFDISGTVLDYGSRAPVAAFVELFARNGVSVTVDEVRRPMGLHKPDHIWAMLSEPSIAARWQKANGSAPTRALVDKLYETFGPLQTEVVKHHCDVLPGVPELVRELRARGIKIANTTGFDSWMIGDLKRLAAQGGYEPDLWVSPDEVGGGRPAPWMIFHAARRLGVYPPSAMVKVGDTVADIAEAKAAGVWSVGVVEHGSEVGLSKEEAAALPADEHAQRIAAARARLEAHSPNYIIPTTAALMPVIDDISRRIARGEKP